MSTADVPASPAAIDVEVVRAMARGEESAATVLFDRHAPPMYGLALRIVGNAADAEDVVLDAFAQAWREASRSDTRSGSVPGWLATITRTRALALAQARGGGALAGDAAAAVRDEPTATVAGTRGPDALPLDAAAEGAMGRDGVVTPPPSLRDRLQARIAVEAGTQAAAQVLSESVPEAVPSGARAQDALDELRARINAGGASASGGATVSRHTPTSRAVRVTPLRTPAAQASVPPTGRVSKVGWYIAAVMTAGLAATVYFTLDLRNQLAWLKADARDRTAQIARLEAKLRDKERTLSTVLTGRGNVVLVNLNASAPTGPGMQLFWNVREGKAVLNAYGLAQVGTNRSYVLWMIRDGMPVRLKLFLPDDDGRALLADVEMPGTTMGITQLSVTEEAAQGADAPTMTPFLTGAVAGAR